MTFRASNVIPQTAYQTVKGAAVQGTAADLAVRAAVYTHCKRNATIVEKLYATGAGDTENPALLAFEGEVTWQDVVNAMEVA